MGDAEPAITETRVYRNVGFGIRGSLGEIANNCGVVEGLGQQLHSNWLDKDFNIARSLPMPCELAGHSIFSQMWRGSVVAYLLCTYLLKGMYQQIRNVQEFLYNVQETSGFLVHCTRNNTIMYKISCTFSLVVHFEKCTKVLKNSCTMYKNFMEHRHEFLYNVQEISNFLYNVQEFNLYESRSGKPVQCTRKTWKSGYSCTLYRKYVVHFEDVQDILVHVVVHLSCA